MLFRSDVPIRFSKKMRQKLIAASKFKGLKDVPKFLKGLSLKDLAPEAPAIAEFSTGEVMGHSRYRDRCHCCRSCAVVGFADDDGTWRSGKVAASEAALMVRCRSRDCAVLDSPLCECTAGTSDCRRRNVYD